MKISHFLNVTCSDQLHFQGEMICGDHCLFLGLFIMVSHSLRIVSRLHLGNSHFLKVILAVSHFLRLCSDQQLSGVISDSLLKCDDQLLS